MTDNKLLELLQRLLASYLSASKSERVWLCVHTFDMAEQGKITAEEARYLRRYIGSYIESHKYERGVCLENAYTYRYVKVGWFFWRKETHRELRIRWLNEQLRIIAEQV